MIRVTDDGEGIEADDVETAFKRHATSKITSREDLFRVATLGFRGEALPSIASVSDVVLMTAHAGDETGTTIHIKGGKIVSNDASQLRNGTQITVSDLFFNTPARLKYLSSLATELSHVSDIVNRLALSHSDVAFVLKNNGKTLLKTAGNGNQKQTFSAIYGVKAAAKMISFNAKDLDFEVDGMVSYPELTRSNRNGISLLINGFRSQLVKDGDMLDIPDICELLEAELLGVVLEDEAIIVAQNHGMPVMGQHAAKGLHTVSENCYRNIARRITGEDVKIPDYTRTENIFTRIFFRRNVTKERGNTANERGSVTKEHVME